MSWEVTSKRALGCNSRPPSCLSVGTTERAHFISFRGKSFPSPVFTASVKAFSTSQKYDIYLILIKPWNSHTGELNVHTFAERRIWHWCTIKLADKLKATQGKAKDIGSSTGLNWHSSLEIRKLYYCHRNSTRGVAGQPIKPQVWHALISLKYRACQGVTKAPVNTWPQEIQHRGQACRDKETQPREAGAGRRWERSLQRTAQLPKGFGHQHAERGKST